MRNPVLVAGDLVTAYGRGIDAAWQGLLSGRTALAVSGRIAFPGGADKTPLGLVPDVDPRSGPAVLQMLEPMLRGLLPQIPAESLILLATTTGEIECLEAATLKQAGAPAIDASDPGRLLEKLCALCGLPRGRILSAACASSTIAVAQAAALISSGTEESVLVIACDAVSEFVYAGFATMNALDPAGARPFDRDRQGLNLGEAAAVALVMSDARAARERRPVMGRIAGWAASNDASHVTRPDTTGGQLARAARRAMERAGVAPDQIGFISAHGTGTGYNDAMEMAAFRSVFSARPVFSLKGALGHTLGAAGLVEILICLRALSEGVVPPTVGLRQPDDCASGWVSECPTPLAPDGCRAALTTNSGFGGINAALVLALDQVGPDGPGLSSTLAFPAALLSSERISDGNKQGEQASRLFGDWPSRSNRHMHGRDAHAPCGLVAPADNFGNEPPSSGIGWITGTAYGLVRHGETLPRADKQAGAGIAGSVDALFRHKIERFGRFDPVSRMTCLACELALQDAGVDYSPEARQEIGILGAGFEGSLAANAVYFKDYVESGRILARGNLFVYTLPTAPLGEAAIHFGFQGPLFSLISPATPLADALEAASALVKSGDAPAMLVVQAGADSAVAAFVTAESPPLLDFLATLAAGSPQLSQLIPKLTTHTENPGL
jgi:3-oxoacyl-[acyl-carrier-protein] synthase II